MRPKLSEQELEQLLEAEFLEAEAVAAAEAESEAQTKESPYRVDEDLSSRLNLPRDVKGLAELVENKAMLFDSQKVLDESSSEPGFREGMIDVSGVLVGGAPGAILMQYPDYGLFYVGAMIVTLGGLFAGDIMGAKISKKVHESSQKYKEFEQEKAAKMAELEKQIETIDQKLSHYQTNYIKGDLLLAAAEKSVFIGKVYAEFEEEEAAEFHIASLSDPQLRVKADTTVCVLTPARELSIDDLYSLDSKTPIVYNEGEHGQQEYGFVEKREKDFLIRNGPGMEVKKAYPLHLLESIIINPRTLVPELKPRIRL
ncbi:MAG: hypothetical protein Q7S55_01340 [Nanoarchaeota archaeon]|nr:hypothetical protein [Nanoarchaeota archaeon]